MPSVASERLYGGVLATTTATVFTASLRTEITLLRITDATAENEAVERLYGGTIGSSVATAFTASGRTVITAMRIADATDAVDSDAVAAVYHLPSGDTRGDQHLIYAGGIVTEENPGIVLEDGDKIDVGADTASELVLTLYGAEVLVDPVASVYHVPSGATRSDQHLIYSGGSTIDSPSSVGAGIVLEAGDTIDAGADTADELVLVLYGTTESIVGGID